MVQTITTIIQVFDKASQPIKRISKTLHDFGTKQKEVSTVFDKTNRAISRQTKEISGLRKRFQMQYLSVLFFGMAIQRVFMGIMRSSTQAFLKMTEGQTEAGQALNALSAGIEYLKFSIGDALGAFLMPFLPTILDIVEGFSDWVSQNRDLVASIIILAAAFGTLLFFAATLKLGLAGLSMIFGVSGLMGSIGAFKTFLTVTFIPYISMIYTWLTTLVIPGIVGAVSTGVATISTSLLTLLANPITWLIVGIVALYFAWETNFLGIKEITYDVAGTVARVLTQMGKGIINLTWIIFNAQAALEKLMFGAAATSTIEQMNKLATMSQTIDKFLAFTYTDEATKKSYMDFKPIMSFLEQMGKDFSGATGGGMNIGNVTVENVEINSPTVEPLTNSDLEKMFDKSLETVMDEMRRRTNVTVGV